MVLGRLWLWLLLLGWSLLLRHLLQGPPVRAPLLLLLPQDLVVDLISIVLHPQLRVVVDWDADDAVAIKLVIRIMELHNIGVSQSFLSRNAPTGIELEAQAQEVQCLTRSSGEHLSEWLGPVLWQGLEHGGRKG